MNIHPKHKKKENRLNYKIRQQLKQINTQESSIPNAPPLHNDEHFDKVMDCIRNFELRQMSIKFNFFIVCKERRFICRVSP